MRQNVNNKFDLYFRTGKFLMNRLGILQDRIAKRLGVNQAAIHSHLLKMPVLANSINGDFPSYNAFPGKDLPLSHKYFWTS